MGRIFEVRKSTMFARWDKMAKQFTRIGKEIERELEKKRKKEGLILLEPVVKDLLSVAEKMAIVL